MIGYLLWEPFNLHSVSQGSYGKPNQKGIYPIQFCIVNYMIVDAEARYQKRFLVHFIDKMDCIEMIYFLDLMTKKYDCILTN